MSVYLVTWNLNREKPNYSEARTRFINRLDQYENIRDPGLESVAFVSVGNLTASDISNDLRANMDNNDSIMVTKLVSGNHQGWLSQNVWNWINARL